MFEVSVRQFCTCPGYTCVTSGILLSRRLCLRWACSFLGTASRQAVGIATAPSAQPEMLTRAPFADQFILGTKGNKKRTACQRMLKTSACYRVVVGRNSFAVRALDTDLGGPEGCGPLRKASGRGDSERPGLGEDAE
jgi:hypothetical protein